MSIASTLPLVLLAPLTGQVVDRLSAKRLLTLLGLAEPVICVGVGAWHGLAATLALMVALSTCVAFSRTPATRRWCPLSRATTTSCGPRA